MELKIIQEKQSLLFPRKEIELVITNNIAPSHAQVKEQVSKKFSSSEETIRIKKIAGRFGSHDFKTTVFLYKTREDLDRIEIKTKQEKEAEKKALEEANKSEEKTEEN